MSEFTLSSNAGMVDVDEYRLHTIVDITKIFLERDIDPTVRFDFNDDVTRRGIISRLSDFFEAFVKLGYIKDYEIWCDENNNTGAVIDANEFVLDIYTKTDIPHLHFHAIFGRGEPVIEIVKYVSYLDQVPL